MSAQKKVVELPPMPDPAPAFAIQVKAELLNDFERYSTGSMVMREHAADVAIDGKTVGSVSYAWSAGCAVIIGKRTYIVRFADIFEAIYETDKANT